MVFQVIHDLGVDMAHDGTLVIVINVSYSGYSKLVRRGVRDVGKLA